MESLYYTIIGLIGTKVLNNMLFKQLTRLNNRYMIGTLYRFNRYTLLVENESHSQCCYFPARIVHVGKDTRESCTIVGMILAC